MSSLRDELLTAIALYLAEGIELDDALGILLEILGSVKVDYVGVFSFELYLDVFGFECKDVSAVLGRHVDDAKAVLEREYDVVFDLDDVWRLTGLLNDAFTDLGSMIAFKCLLDGDCGGSIYCVWGSSGQSLGFALPYVGYADSQAREAFGRVKRYVDEVYGSECHFRPTRECLEKVFGDG